MKARRIQRLRVAGWRAPANAVAVDRPSRFANPHTVDRIVEREGVELGRARTLALTRFAADLAVGRLPVTVADVRAELKGKHLVCWCPEGEPCHADILLAVANG